MDIICQSAARRSRWGFTGFKCTLRVLPCAVLAGHRHKSGYVSLIQGLPLCTGAKAVSHLFLFPEVPGFYRRT